MTPALPRAGALRDAALALVASRALVWAMGVSAYLLFNLAGGMAGGAGAPGPPDRARGGRRQRAAGGAAAGLLPHLAVLLGRLHRGAVPGAGAGSVRGRAARALGLGGRPGRAGRRDAEHR